MIKQDTASLNSCLSLTKNEREAISEFVDILRAKLGSTISEIILFGSKVRGKEVNDSDIDILIVIDSLSWEVKKTISELAAQENMKYSVLISTIRYDAKTWENPVIKLSPFGNAVRKEGIQL